MADFPTANEVALAWANGKKWVDIVADFEKALHRAYAEGFDAGYNAAGRDWSDSNLIGM